MGHIELIVGPMFCGKTTELKLRMRRHMHARKRVLLVKYAGDARYEDGDEVSVGRRMVVTHDAARTEAHVAVRRLADVVVPSGTAVILVDEAQFMPDAAEVCDAWASAGYTVIVAALDGDYTRTPFPPIARLMARAERVDKRSAVCVVCGQDAAFTHRKAAAAAVTTAVELIGGEETYEPRCRACWT